MPRSIVRFAGPATLALLGVVLLTPRLAKGSAPGPKAGPSLATFAGGCFWSMQKAFDGVPGVVTVTAGYAGGTKAKPSYEDVESGRTGHAESVEVIYDPAKISYPQLLDVYWHHIDPLTVNSAFCDYGPQYRSIIFYHDAEQRRPAEASKRALDQSHRFKHADRDPDSAGHAVLSGRGVSPAVLPEEPGTVRGVPDWLPAGCPAAGAVGRPGYLQGSDEVKVTTILGIAAAALLWGSGGLAAQTHATGWNAMTFKKPSDGELKQRLTPEQYTVTQHEGTERPFSNAYWDNHEAGIYVDIVSGEPLFSSLDKYDSRHRLAELHPAARAGEPQDPGRPQAHRGSHRGALGPRRLAPGPRLRRRPAPTGLRYCMNSAALRFVPVDRLEAEGYGKYLGLFKKGADAAHK